MVSASGNWTLVTAGQYCDSVMSSSSIMDKCQTLVGASFTEAIRDICVQTVLVSVSNCHITNSIKFYCYKYN